jgi:hypothetical protein
MEIFEDPGTHPPPLHEGNNTNFLGCLVRVCCLDITCMQTWTRPGTTEKLELEVLNLSWPWCVCCCASKP